MGIDFEQVVAGVGSNGLTKSYEIKILCCYLLDRVGEPLTLPQLYAAVNSQNLAGYVELADALSNLVKTGHLTVSTKDDEQVYQVTEVGKETASVLQAVLPAATRERVADSGLNVLIQSKKEAIGKAKLVKEEEKLYVLCTVTDRENILASVRFYVPDEMQGQRMIDHFMADPQGFYQNLMSNLIATKD